MILKPINLFSYEPSEACRLDSILEDKLYLSKPINFNDISECTCQIESIDKSNIPREQLVNAILTIYDKPFDEIKHNFLLDESIHKFMIGAIKNEMIGTQFDVLEKIIKRVGGALIKCFTPLDNNNVMWSHYGKNYSGLSIGYEASRFFSSSTFSFIRPVSYQNERPCFSLIDALFKPQTVFNELLLTKQADWSYEREQRLCMFSGKECLNSENGKLISMPKNLRVLSVTFGTLCPVDYILEYAPKLMSKRVNCYYLENYSKQRRLDEVELMNNGKWLRELIEAKNRAPLSYV